MYSIILKIWTLAVCFSFCLSLSYMSLPLHRSSREICGKKENGARGCQKVWNKSMMSEVGRKKWIYEAVVLICLCLDPAKNSTSFWKYSCSQPLTPKCWSSRSGVAATSPDTLIPAPNLVFMDKLLLTWLFSNIFCFQLDVLVLNSTKSALNILTSSVGNTSENHGMLFSYHSTVPRTCLAVVNPSLAAFHCQPAHTPWWLHPNWMVKGNQHPPMF